MRNVVQVFLKSLRLFLFFTGCTVLFYYGIMWINEEYENYRRYDEPEGAAVKAFMPIGEKDNGWFDRLLFFYRNGE